MSMKKNNIINEKSSNAFRETQNLYQKAIRKAILDSASDLFIQKGPSALTMRGISQTVGCSTSVLYTMFGSKQGLISEIYRSGFDILYQTLKAVSYPECSLDYLFAIGRAYRSFALDNSAYYSLMFLQAIPEYPPEKADRQFGQETSELFMQAVRNCLNASESTLDDPGEIAYMIWGTLHGHIGLELIGYFQNPLAAQQRFEKVFQALVIGLGLNEQDILMTLDKNGKLT